MKCVWVLVVFLMLSGCRNFRDLDTVGVPDGDTNSDVCATGCRVDAGG
jgi:hypothetical protein